MHRKGTGGPPADVVPGLLKAYYRHVAPEDVCDRTEVDLYGALASHYKLAAVPSAGHRPGPGVHPHGLRARLVGQRALGRRGGHRRHAVPRRLGDDGAVRPAAQHPRDRAPAVRGHPRHHRLAAVRARGRRGQHRHRRRHPARVVDAHRDRPDPRGRGRRRDRVRAAERAARRPRGRRGLAAHARAGAGDRRRAGHRAAAAAGRGDRAGPGAAPVAGRRPLHVPRLPRVPPRARGRRRGAPRDPRHRLRHPPRRPGHVGLVRQAPRPGQGQGPREEAAGAGQGQLPRDRAPPGVPRLRRREDLRRRRRRGRRAPVPRAVLERRLHRVRQPDPDGAREGRRGAGPGRLRHPQPRRQGVDGHPRELPARRAVPDPGRGAGADRRGRDVHPRAPAAAAVRAPRHLRPVPLLPGLPPARPLQHHGPRADLRDPQAPARWRVRGVHRPGQRVQHGPAALRGAPAEGRADGRGRRASTSSAASSTRPAPGTTTSPPR